jgi:hypothetical protein
MTESSFMRILSGANRPIALVVALMLAVYFPAMYWSRRGYVPLPEPKGAVVHLQSFHKLGLPDSFAYIAVAQLVQKLADTPDAPERSPYVIYEDDKPLGPAHSAEEDVVTIGRGRFLHKGDIFVLSTSDNSDPRVNGRNYWVALPPR